MIVRILHEGQFELEDAGRKDLDALDVRLMAAIDGGDEGGYRAALEGLLNRVRKGRTLGQDELRSSDLVLPAADFTLGEAKDLLEPRD